MDHGTEMSKEEAYKAWLEQGGSQAEPARSTRAYAIRTIEKNLAALGLPYKDLDEAWGADRLEGLRDRLKQVRDDARAGGQDYRILMPASENPHNRLSSWLSWLGQYGRFLAGESPRAVKDADKIRQYVLEQYIEPAREADREQVEVIVRDVNSALGLNQAWPNICQALAGRMFQELADLPPPEQIGADQSSATIFRFDLRGGLVSRKALEKLRERFIELCPDFASFREPGTGWAQGEKAYKLAAMDRAKATMVPGKSDENVGRDVFEVLKTAAKDGPLVRWQTEDSIAKGLPDLLSEFHSIVGRLVRSDRPPAEALSDADNALQELRTKGATSLTYGERINIVSSAMSMMRPTTMAPLKITRINDVWELLTGEKLFVETRADMARDYRRFAEGFTEIFEIMRVEWR